MCWHVRLPVAMEVQCLLEAIQSFQQLRPRVHHADSGDHFAGASEWNPGDSVEGLLGVLAGCEVTDGLNALAVNVAVERPKPGLVIGDLFAEFTPVIAELMTPWIS